MPSLYVPLGVTYYLDEKFAHVSPWGEILYVRSLCLAKTLLTDGLLSDRQLNFLGVDDLRARLHELVEAGLFAKTPEGWQIVTWLKHNRSAAHVESLSATRREAGKQGGRPPGKQNANQIALTDESKPETHSRVEQSQEEQDSESPPGTGADPKGGSTELSTISGVEMLTTRFATAPGAPTTRKLKGYGFTYGKKTHRWSCPNPKPEAVVFLDELSEDLGMTVKQTGGYREALP